MSERITLTGREISNRWPHIGRYLRVASSGWVDDDYLRWYFANERVSLPCVEVAAAYEEWAEFYQFRLEQRSDELAEDYRKPQPRGALDRGHDVLHSAVRGLCAW